MTLNVNLHKALINLAERKNLNPTPFRSKHIQLRVYFDKNGQLDKVVADSSSYSLPVEQDRTAQIAPNFGYDSPKYVVSTDLTQAAPKSAKPQLFEAFYSQLHHSLLNCGDQARASIVSKIINLGPKTLSRRFIQLLSGVDVNPSHMSWILVVLGDDADPVVLLKDVRDDWAHQFNKTLGSGTRATCMITGKKDVPCSRVMSKARKIPGANKAPLISFNQPVFCYEDRVQGENFPIARDVDISLANALTWLFEQSENRQHRNGFSFCGSDPRQPAVAIWGSSDDADSIIENILNLVQLPRLGVKSDDYLKCSMAFYDKCLEDLEKASDTQHWAYILGIVGSKGRIAITAWYPIALRDLISSFFKALDIIPDARPFGLLNALRKITGEHLSGQATSRLLIDILSGNSWTCEFREAAWAYANIAYKDIHSVSKSIEMAGRI
jgi:hypothetical protein